MLKGQPLKLGGAWINADEDPGPDFYLEVEKVGKQADNVDQENFTIYLDEYAKDLPQDRFNLLANDFKTEILLSLSTNIAMRSGEPMNASSTTKLYGMTSSERSILYNMTMGRYDPMRLPSIYSTGGVEAGVIDPLLLGPSSDPNATSLYSGIHLAYLSQLYWPLAVLLESMGALDLGGSIAPLPPQDDAQSSSAETVKRQIATVSDLVSQHFRSYLSSGTSPQQHREGLIKGEDTIFPDNLIAAAKYHPSLMENYSLLRSIDAEKQTRPGRFASMAHYEASTVSGNKDLDSESRFRTVLEPVFDGSIPEPMLIMNEVTAIEGLLDINPLANIPNPLWRGTSIPTRQHLIDTPLHIPATGYIKDDGESRVTGRAPSVLRVSYADSNALLATDKAEDHAVQRSTTTYFTNAYIQHEVMELHGIVGGLELAPDQQPASPSPSERLVDQLLLDANARNYPYLGIHPGDYMSGLGTHVLEKHWTALACWEHTPFLAWHQNITGLFLQNAVNWTILQRLEARSMQITGKSRQGGNPRVEAMIGAALDQVSSALLFGARDSTYRSVYMDMYHNEEAVAEHTPIMREEVVTYISWAFQLQVDQFRFSDSKATGRRRTVEEVTVEASIRDVHPEFVPPLTEGLKSERLDSLYSEMLASFQVLHLDYTLIHDAIRLFWRHTTHPVFAPTVDSPRIHTFITGYYRELFLNTFDNQGGFTGPPRAKKIRRQKEETTLSIFTLNDAEAKATIKAMSPSEWSSHQFVARMVSTVITRVLHDILRRDALPTLRKNDTEAYDAYMAYFFHLDTAKKDKDSDRAMPISLSSYVRNGLVVRVNRETDRLIDEWVKNSLRDTTVDLFARYLTMLVGSEGQKNTMRDVTDDSLSSIDDEQTMESIVEVFDAYIFLNGTNVIMKDFYDEALKRAIVWGFTEADLYDSVTVLAKRTTEVMFDIPTLFAEPLSVKYPRPALPVGSSEDQKPSLVPRNLSDALDAGPFSPASMLASMREDMPMIPLLLYDHLKYSFKSSSDPRTISLQNVNKKTGQKEPLVYTHPARKLPSNTTSLSVTLPPPKADSRRWSANTFSSWIRHEPLFDHQQAYIHRMMKYDEYAMASQRRDPTIQFLWTRSNADIRVQFTYVAPNDVKMARIRWLVNEVEVRTFYSLLSQDNGDPLETTGAPEDNVRWFQTKIRISRNPTSYNKATEVKEVDRSLESMLTVCCSIQFYYDTAGSFPSPVQCESYTTVNAPFNTMRVTPAYARSEAPPSDIMWKIGKNEEEERHLGELRDILRADASQWASLSQEEKDDKTRYYHDLYHHASSHTPKEIRDKTVVEDLAPSRPYQNTAAYAGVLKDKYNAGNYVYAQVLV